MEEKEAMSTKGAIIIPLSDLSESEPCPVNGCNESFLYWPPDEWPKKGNHLLAHFQAVFPAPPRPADWKIRIGGVWRCPVPNCHTTFCAETVGWIMQHKIRHVQENPELFNCRY